MNRLVGVDRTNHGEPVEAFRGARQKARKMNSGDGGLNRSEGAFDIRGCVRFRIERIQLARTAVLEQDDACTLASLLLPCQQRVQIEPS